MRLGLGRGIGNLGRSLGMPRVSVPSIKPVTEPRLSSRVVRTPKFRPLRLPRV